MIRNHGTKVLTFLVLIFDRGFQPVLGIQIHHITALIEAVMASSALCLSSMDCLCTRFTQIENITQDIAASYGINPQSRFLRDASMDKVPQQKLSVKERQNANILVISLVLCYTYFNRENCRGSGAIQCILRCGDSVLFLSSRLTVYSSTCILIVNSGNRDWVPAA